MNLATFENTPIPAYYHLQLTMQKEIEQGNWTPGEQIATERQLALEHGLSIGTVKKAITNLVNQGYLYRIQGKGTFVAGTEMRRKHIRYYKMLRNPKDKPANLNIEFLSIKRIPGRLPDSKYLQTPLSQDLFEIRRMFSWQGNPLILTVSMLPATMFPDLDKQDKAFFDHNLLYVALEQSYGMTTVSNQELFSAIAATQELAATLGVMEGKPLLFLEMLSFTYKKKPYEYRKAYCLSDDRKISVDF